METNAAAPGPREDRRFDVMDAQCPSRLVLQGLGDKWTPLVFQVLRDGPLRFSAIRDSIGRVTPKVLTYTLRTLMRDGLVSRQAFGEVPPRVEYALTDLGRTLLGPLDAARDWAEANAGAVLRSREEFEAREEPRASS